MPIKNKIQRGVTLIEAMIALLVISVGLLGIASLQITAVSQNTSALNHNKSVWFAYNMSDRIRANLPQFVNYVGVDTDNAPPQDCESANCTNAQIVLADAADWKFMIEEALPGGRGTILSNLANDGLLVIVMWDDDGTQTDTGCDPIDPDDLTCYTLAVAQPLAVP